jgi:hypothetical protein
MLAAECLSNAVKAQLEGCPFGKGAGPPICWVQHPCRMGGPHLYSRQTMVWENITLVGRISQGRYRQNETTLG